MALYKLFKCRSRFTRQKYESIITMYKEYTFQLWLDSLSPEEHAKYVFEKRGMEIARQRELDRLLSAFKITERFLNSKCDSYYLR